MKFLIDAQLPKKLSNYLESKGYDSIHTLDLPKANRTLDSEINKISLSEERIVISKDADFYNSHIQKLEPYKLLYLSMGNISSTSLIEIFEKNPKIFEEIQTNFVVEVSETSIITIL